MNVAFIPVRGGSKSIPLKNIKTLCGKPLVYWTVLAACECKSIDKVYVSTDSAEIKATVEMFCNRSEVQSLSKVEVVGRSRESATDTASTESVMLEFAKDNAFDNIVLIQATSPLLTGDDLDRGFSMFAKENVDCVISAVRQKRFVWNIDQQGLAHPENYDVYKRPRRQEFNGYLVENGAFYITSRELLLKTQNRVSGNIAAVEMDESTYYEIDEPSDWLIIETLMKRRLNNKIPARIPEIQMFLTDCDGCLTDAGMYYAESGDEMKKFSTLDGMGFSLLKKNGIVTGIITGETSDIVKHRAAKLNIDILEMGVQDKLSCIQSICRKRNIPLEHTVYVGDDINDTEAISKVGFGCSVANAMPEAKSAASYVTLRSGGSGAVREIIDLILSSK